VNRWQAVVSLLVLVFLGLFVYLGLRIAVAYRQGLESAQFLQRYQTYTSQDLPDIAELPKLRDEINRLVATHPTTELKSAQFMINLRYAGTFPDTSFEAFRTGIARGQEYYSANGQTGSDLSSYLCWAYLAAGLPAQVKRWNTRILPQAPATREEVHLFEAAADILLDDEEAATALVRDDLRRHGGVGETRAMAGAIFITLRDYDEVQIYEGDLLNYLTANPNYYPIYIDYLIDKRRFDSARALNMPPDMGEANPSAWLQRATVLAEHNGLHNSAVTSLLDKVATNPQYDSTTASLSAGIAGRLWEATGEGRWWDSLTAAVRLQPQDAETLTALARGWAERPPSETQRADARLPVGLDSALSAGNAAVAAAQKPVEKLDALFALFQAACQPRSDGSYVPGSSDQALEAFKRACGDPALPGSVKDARPPWYADLLTRPSIVKRRKADPAFSSALHQAIIDYVNRRQGQFADLVPLPPVEAGSKPAS
jgi:hypothetical protein